MGLQAPCSVFVYCGNVVPHVCTQLDSPAATLPLPSPPLPHHPPPQRWYMFLFFNSGNKGNVQRVISGALLNGDKRRGVLDHVMPHGSSFVVVVVVISPLKLTYFWHFHAKSVGFGRLPSITSS